MQVHEQYRLYTGNDYYTLVAQSPHHPQTLTVTRATGHLSLQGALLSLPLSPFDLLG